MAILVGIDGTGSAMFPTAARDREYDKTFANSFVSRLCKTDSPNTRYFRGPVALGGGLVDAINAGHGFILSRRAAGVNEDVLLTGYSRGAAGVVSMAKKLQDSKVDVRALLLFDCVDRHLFIDAAVVPNNVAHVLHVIRDPRAESRESFDNDALQTTPPTNYTTAYAFMCTHGAMGGQPWKPKSGRGGHAFIDEGGLDGKTKITYAQDGAASAQIWAFCQDFMKEHGFISK